MDQTTYPEYEGKYEGYTQPPDYTQQPANPGMVQLSNVATPPQAQVITSQPGTNTNVVVMTGQPVTSNFINVNPGVKPWSSGVCSCFDDLGTCLCVTFCGVCTATRAAKRLGEHPCVPCCVPGAMVTLRTKLRILLGVQGTICNDCLTVAFCGHCALCQLHREMDRAGIPDAGCC